MRGATAQVTGLQASGEESVAGAAGSRGAPPVRCQIQMRCRRSQPPGIAASDPAPATKMRTLMRARVDRTLPCCRWSELWEAAPN